MLPHIRLGLRETDTFSDDSQALFRYTSDKLAATCVVQTFHYVVIGGLSIAISQLYPGQPDTRLHPPCDWYSDPSQQMVSMLKNDGLRVSSARGRPLRSAMQARNHKHAEQAKPDV